MSVSDALIYQLSVARGRPVVWVLLNVNHLPVIMRFVGMCGMASMHSREESGGHSSDSNRNLQKLGVIYCLNRLSASFNHPKLLLI